MCLFIFYFVFVLRGGGGGRGGRIWEGATGDCNFVTADMFSQSLTDVAAKLTCDLDIHARCSCHT